MKRLLGAAAFAVASASALASDVGVAVSIGQPGFYGRIEIGNLPPPQLVYAHPIVVQPVAGVASPPIYLRVPPGHAKNWRKHCAHYNACGQPVYFVSDGWYNDVYVAHYRGGYRVESEPVALAAPAYEYRPAPPQERLYEVPVTAVRAVVGPPEQRCWVERQQVVDERNDAPNVPGAIAGAVIGGVLGHQVGSGRGRDVATAGGAVAGAAIGANVGRGGTQVYSQDVQRCAAVEGRPRPDYWDVRYTFRGVEHRVQMSAPPRATIMVNIYGEPRG
jgi:uncharacterized protein YcfJ